MATTTSKTSTPTTEDLAKQVDTIKNDIANLTKTLSEFGKAQGDYLTAEAKKGARDLRRAGEEQMDVMRAQARDASRQAEEFVSGNPAMALGIAAGAGFLIGLITSRR